MGLFPGPTVTPGVGVFPGVGDQGLQAPAFAFLPHFDAPFRLDGAGRAVVVQQDSPVEIGAAVYNVCVCVQGAKLADPAFGIPSPLFQNLPVNLPGVAQAVQRLEPRAQTSASESLSSLALTVTYVSSQLLPGEALPGARTVPDPGVPVTTLQGGPGSVDVGVSAIVPGRRQ